MLDWEAMRKKVTERDARLIDKVVDRVRRDVRMNALRRQTFDWHMDVLVVHATVGLDLQRLLDADDFNFRHDILGIYTELDRSTGKLGDCFLPRFTLRGQGEPDTMDAYSNG
jgi:hypothetical protein